MRHLTERFFLKSVPESDFSFDHKSVGKSQLKHQVDFKIHKEEIMCQEIWEKKKKGGT